MHAWHTGVPAAEETLRLLKLKFCLACGQVIVHQYDHTLATETFLYSLFPFLGRVCDKYVFPVHGAAVAGLGNLIFHHLQHKARFLGCPVPEKQLAGRLPGKDHCSMLRSSLGWAGYGRCAPP
jgi:hypothetical protein